jgi:hypothetical protein
MPEIIVLARASRHDEFAALPVRDASFRAIAIQPGAPIHAKAGLKAFGFVADA